MASEYSDADWVRSIRSGVRPNGLPLLFMPSHEYRPMGPEDLGALVSWIKSMPPVDTDPVEQKIGLLGRVLFLAGQLPLIPAERIDHSDPSFSQPEADVTVVYGAYLATACAGCHGEGFSGGVIPGVPPEWPEAANLTPDVDTGVGLWSEDDFFILLPRRRASRRSSSRRGLHAVADRPVVHGRREAGPLDVLAIAAGYVEGGLAAGLGYTRTANRRRVRSWKGGRRPPRRSLRLRSCRHPPRPGRRHRTRRRRCRSSRA